MLVVAIDDKDQATELVRHVHHSHPHVHIIARAIDRDHVYELYAAGSRDIIRDTFDSAVRAGRSALEALGTHPFVAERQARGFTRRDGEALRELAALYDPDIPQHENTAYVARVREMQTELEDAMRGGKSAFGTRIDRGWSPPTESDVKAEEAG